jgi:dolichyl-phosphate-mannose--protein O-mannosyl transferase
MVSFLVRVIFIQYPAVVVFDETHFGSFVSDYIRGISFFDIHPPLAKLILTGVSHVIGYDGTFNFSECDTPYDSNFYIWLRLTPAIFCSFAGPFMTAALLLKRVPVPFAFTAGFLFSLDIVSVVQSRFILTDGILYFFVALTFLLTAVFPLHESFFILILQSFSASCAFCVKFTSAGLFVYIGLSHFRLVYGKRLWFLTLIVRGSLVSLVFAICLTGLLWTHLQMLPHPGIGDRYFPAGFRERSAPARIFGLLCAMYCYNRDLRATHPCESRWYRWPFCAGAPIPFWVSGSARVILIPNPVALLSSTIGFLIGLFRGELALSVGYAISYFPFALVARPTFLYHHEIPVMFGLMQFATAAKKVFPAYAQDAVREIAVVGGSICYVMFSPLVYGMPMEWFVGSLAKT